MGESIKDKKKAIEKFAYILLIWKMTEAIGSAIAGPVFDRMHPEVHYGWFTRELAIIMAVIDALSAVLLISLIRSGKNRLLALILFGSTGSIWFVHFITVSRINIFHFLISYWECMVLTFFMWREGRKSPKTPRIYGLDR